MRTHLEDDLGDEHARVEDAAGGRGADDEGKGNAKRVGQANGEQVALRLAGHRGEHEGGSGDLAGEGVEPDWQAKDSEPCVQQGGEG